MERITHELERTWKEAVVAYLKLLSSGGKPQETYSGQQVSNPKFPNNEAGVLITMQRRYFKMLFIIHLDTLTESMKIYSQDRRPKLATNLEPSCMYIYLRRLISIYCLHVHDR